MECDGCGVELDLYEMEVTDSGEMLCYRCYAEHSGEYEDHSYDDQDDF